MHFSGTCLNTPPKQYASVPMQTILTILRSTRRTRSRTITFLPVQRMHIKPKPRQHTQPIVVTTPSNRPNTLAQPFRTRLNAELCVFTHNSRIAGNIGRTLTNTQPIATPADTNARHRECAVECRKQQTGNITPNTPLTSIRMQGTHGTTRILHTEPMIHQPQQCAQHKDIPTEPRALFMRVYTRIYV